MREERKNFTRAVCLDHNKDDAIAKFADEAKDEGELSQWFLIAPNWK